MVDRRHSLNLMDKTIERIRELPNVTHVYPVYELPVIAELREGHVVRTTLRARIPSLDESLGFTGWVTEGRYLSGKSGEALVENWVPHVEVSGRAYFGYQRLNGKRVVFDNGFPQLTPNWVPETGSVLRLRLPSVTVEGDELNFDYDRTLSRELKVVGTLRLPSDKVHWGKERVTAEGIELFGPRVDPDYPSHFVTEEQRYWTTNQVQVSLDTFLDLARAVGLDEPRPSALLVGVRQLRLVNETVEELRTALEGGTILSVPDWFETQELLPEPLIQVPPDDALALRFGEGEAAVRSFAPPGVVTTLLVGLAYLMGGTLYAGNIYLLLTQRKKELAIMRVLGARASQVLTAMVTEAGLLAVGGALLGALLMSPPVLWQLGTSRLTVLELATSYGAVVLQVMALAAGVALLFGGLPAYLVVRRTIEQVLYDEA